MFLQHVPVAVLQKAAQCGGWEHDHWLHSAWAESPALPLFQVQPWVYSLSALCPSFFICKIGILIMYLPQRVLSKIKRSNSQYV